VRGFCIDREVRGIQTGESRGKSTAAKHYVGLSDKKKKGGRIYTRVCPQKKASRRVIWDETEITVKARGFLRRSQPKSTAPYDTNVKSRFKTSVNKPRTMESNKNRTAAYDLLVRSSENKKPRSIKPRPTSYNELRRPQEGSLFCVSV